MPYNVHSPSLPARFLTPRRSLVILLLVALFATIGGTLHGLWIDRGEVIRHHAMIAENTAQYLADQARRSIHSTKRVLDDTRRLVTARGGLSGLEQDRDSFELGKLARYLPDIGRLWVFDPEGRPVIGSAWQPDRPFPDFTLAGTKIYEDLAIRGMNWNISSADFSRYDGSLVFVLAEAVRDQDGQLTAILLASLDASIFANSYDMLDRRFEPMVGLYRVDGSIIFRRPEQPGNIGRTIQDDWLFRRNADGSIDTGALEASSGYRHLRSPVDGVTRVVAYHRVSALPLLVVTGISTPAALSEWKGRVERSLAIVMAISLLLGALALAGLASIRREEQLTRRNALLAAAVEAGANAIVITDVTGPRNVLYFNRAFEQLTGFTEEDLIWQPIAAMNGPLTDIGQLARARNDSLPADQRPGPVEVISYRKDGTTFLNRQHIAPVLDDQGRIIAHVAVIWDITDERERERAEHQRQRLESLGQLAGGIAHEINNLLQPIVTLADLNLREGVLPDDEQGRMVANDLSDMLSAARKCREVVGAVLVFARADNAGPAPEPVIVAKSLSAALTLARNALPRSIRLDVIVTAAQSKAAITPTELTQVVMNLMTNASDAMDGEGTITVRLDEQDGELALSVSDHGSGMDEEAIRRAFDPFYTTKQVGRGTGMGLAIVHGVVRRWAGRVMVDSQLSAGTTITVCMPVHGQQQETERDNLPQTA